MRISIFGLGYVGAVSAACFAERGHVVTGVDPNTDKVELINSGRAPVVEAELAQLTRRAVSQKRLRATTDPLSAVLDSEVTFICVPTPSQTNGNLDCRYVERVCAEIGAALREKHDFHVVVMRSTVLPGTLKGLAIPLLERASGRRAGQDFGVCHNPEFLRESTAVADFANPPKTVIGATDSRCADILQRLYEGFPGAVIRCPIEVAEMVKYADNTWHAAKITFAN
ncbi:MAG: nucleotide sugar dehydrogenase, partial [Steroidobacteraceae bacterium]